MNTEFRKKSKSDFEKNFYKLMKNFVFGKTMENLRNRVDIKIVRSNETDKMRKLIASPLYSRHVLFSNDLAGIDIRKSKLVLNKPVYTGMTILDNSKILMYDVFYNQLKKQYGPRCELLYRHRQPSHGDRKGRRIQRHGSKQASVRHERLPKRSSTLFKHQQEGLWKYERRMRRDAHSRMRVPETKGVLNSQGRHKKYQESKRRKKERCQETNNT